MAPTGSDTHHNSDQYGSRFALSSVKARVPTDSGAMFRGDDNFTGHKWKRSSGAMRLTVRLI